MPSFSRSATPAALAGTMLASTQPRQYLAAQAPHQPDQLSHDDWLRVLDNARS